MTRTAGDWFTTMQGEAVPARERAQFSEWLAQSPEHVEAYLEVAAVWRSLGGTSAAQVSVEDLLAQARAEDHAQNVIQLPLPRSQDSSCHFAATDGAGDRGRDSRSPAPSAEATARMRLRSRGRFAAIAASIALLVFAGWIALERVQGTRYSTAIGEQVSFTLEDGSTVRLNTQSAIRVRMREQERVISLVRGEAMFEVARDTRRPFRVHAGGALVEAIGTVFNVNRTKTDTTVTVLEGRVRVSTQPKVRLPTSSSGDEPASGAGTGTGTGVHVAEIAARDSAKVMGGGAIVTEHGVSVERVLAWTDRRLVFHGETLRAVAEEFNRYNRLQVEITDPGLAALRISGNFNATDLRSLIDYLEDVEGMSAEERGDIVYLSRH